MSLKFFHIIFVVASTILCLGFSLWCFGEYNATEASGFLATGVASILSSIGLVGYGIYFFRKIKDLRLS